MKRVSPLRVDRDMMISVRELQPGDDLAVLLKLCKDFFAEYACHHEEFFDTENLSDDDLSGRFLRSMESGDSATIIALVDSEIVGYTSIAIRTQPDFYRIKRVGAISGLMVAKEHRRRGIATQLFAEAKAYFQRSGIKYFTVYTAVANQGAIEFYERNGMTLLHTTLIGDTEGIERGNATGSLSETRV